MGSDNQNTLEKHVVSIESRRELHNAIIASLSSIVASPQWEWLKFHSKVFADEDNASASGDHIDRYAIAVYNDDNSPKALFSVLIDVIENTYTVVSQVGDEAISDLSVENSNVKTQRGSAVYFDEDGNVDSAAGGFHTIASIVSLGAEFVAKIVLEHQKNAGNVEEEIFFEDEDG